MYIGCIDTRVLQLKICSLKIKSLQQWLNPRFLYVFVLNFDFRIYLRYQNSFRPFVGMELGILRGVPLSFDYWVTIQLPRGHFRLCFHPNFFGHKYFNISIQAYPVLVIGSNMVTCKYLCKPKKSPSVPLTSNLYCLKQLMLLQALKPEGYSC